MTRAERIAAIIAEWPQDDLLGYRIAGGCDAGDALPPSRVWDDGEVVEGEYLDGTSAIASDERDAARLLDRYLGEVVILVEGSRAIVGEDIGEVILVDAVALDAVKI